MGRKAQLKKRVNPRAKCRGSMNWANETSSGTGSGKKKT